MPTHLLPSPRVEGRLLLGIYWRVQGLPEMWAGHRAAVRRPTGRWRRSLHEELPRPPGQAPGQLSLALPLPTGGARPLRHEVMPNS